MPRKHPICTYCFFFAESAKSFIKGCKKFRKYSIQNVSFLLDPPQTVIIAFHWVLGDIYSKICQFFSKMPPSKPNFGHLELKILPLTPFSCGSAILVLIGSSPPRPLNVHPSGIGLRLTRLRWEIVFNNYWKFSKIFVFGSKLPKISISSTNCQNGNIKSKLPKKVEFGSKLLILGRNELQGT